MIYIDSDKDKKFIYLRLVNHKHWPYGTQKFTYAINSLSIDAETQLIKIQSTSTGGEQAYTFVNELVIGGKQCTMQNVEQLFAEECYSSIGVSISGDIKIDLTEITDLLKEINEKIKGGGGDIPQDALQAIYCKLGEVSCSLDNIAGEEIGGYYSVDECNRINDTINNINNEEI